TKSEGTGIGLSLSKRVITKSEGTGIGLSLSKRVMQLHGGGIQVHSVPDQETVFRLTFA
ncbi:histidine kinase, partial [Aquicoccus sp. SCR17]|nr:histidine kinase [Carideicomes alvinocaridis]